MKGSSCLVICRKKEKVGCILGLTCYCLVNTLAVCFGGKPLFKRWLVLYEESGALLLDDR